MNKTEVLVTHKSHCPACGSSDYHRWDYNFLTNFLGITKKKFKCDTCGYELIAGDLRKAFEKKQKHKHHKKHHKHHNHKHRHKHHHHK